MYVFRAVKRSNCFHRNGHDAACGESNTTNMIIFACIQIVLSQIPNFHKIWWLSIVAAVMSVAYATIGLGLSIAKIAGGSSKSKPSLFSLSPHASHAFPCSCNAEGPHARTSLTGVTVGVDVSGSEKVWRTFQALGDIAFAYAYSNVLIEIQVMKKATTIGVLTTTTFYMLCGVLGYAAFGNTAPGNFLTGFGFYDPFWLVDIGNICIVVHLVGAYQVNT
ncbi:hypothetical protein GW17_00001559 [Ensete ventricosum]|nr:hypothetical protein GW17_00001559 [Ensete ventricosum]RZR90756.1 hypothetical protein BHM03_00018716 [Ensete ventricosum]